MKDPQASARRELVQKLCVELELSADHDLDCGSLQSLVAGLRVPRRVARLVELDATALSHLSLPALMQLGDTLTIVRAVGNGAVTLELPGGAQHQVPADQLVLAGKGVALELAPSLIGEGSFGARVLDFLGAHYRDLVMVVVCAVFIAALGLTSPVLTGLAVDRALPERTPKLLALIAGTVLFVAVQRALFGWLQRRAVLALQARLEAAVTTSLFDHLIRIPYGALARTSVGSWLETLSGAKRVQTALTETTLVPLLNLSMGLVQGVVLLRLAPQIGAAVIAGAFLLLLTSLGFAFRASRLERSVIETSAREHATLYEVLEGLPTLRSCGASRRGVLRWLDRLLATRTAQVRMDLLAVAARVTVGSARDVLTFGAFIWAALACLQGGLTVGDVLTLSMLSDRFISLVGDFAGVLSPALSARSHIARLDALLAHENVVDRTLALGLPSVSERVDAVVMEDVWFRYAPDQPWVLQGYSLRARNLEQLELRGPSGMGKSTILRLIAGLYQPERGSVRVYGQAPERLRGQICYLPQDARLLSGSILQNLRLLSGASHDALMAAAQESGLAELVKDLPMGYETVLPPGAASLSGGQRQLIAWTAAMASERKLLLMDEALSSVDPLLRARLLRMAHARARTIVSVEHERTRVAAPERAPRVEAVEAVAAS